MLRFHHPLLCALLCAALTVPAVPAAAQTSDAAAPTALSGGGGGLVVGGVNVDVPGKSAIDARNNGWREAQRLAWPMLWARMSGQEAGSAPKLPDSALDSMVSAIEIEHEEAGPSRYVANLAVIFDRERAARYLGRYAALSTSPPLLLLPVLQDAGVRMAHEPHSPWLQAWARLRPGESPIDYIRIQPATADVFLLSAWQAERRHLNIWRAIVERYQVADILIPELILDRSWSGGPLNAQLILYFGPTRKEVGRVRLHNASGNVAALMDEAVRQADRAYIEALRSGHLLPDPELAEPPVQLVQADTGPAIGREATQAGLYSMRLRVLTPDDAALTRTMRQLQALPVVSAVRTVSYAPGGESVIELSASADLAVLRYHLDTQGLRIEGDRLRPRRTDETPLPAPIMSDEVTAGTAPGPAAAAPPSAATPETPPPATPGP
ncbi:MAG: heavy-metal-associated domain-containing protein [Sphingomonadaceae bacterium]